MARRRRTRKWRRQSVRSTLYELARLMGHAEAIGKGRIGQGH